MPETHSPPASSAVPPPPAYDRICAFVAAYAARLPRHPLAGTAVYEYGGCDYALVLHALFPTRCVDLSRLCWSTAPLPAQLEANLAVFCEGARGLRLSDAPTAALSPRALRAEPQCIAGHLRVQHWLYVLAQRFRPDEKFDAATVRMRLRHAQLGEPFLPAKEGEEMAGAEAQGREGDGEGRGNATHCAAVWNAGLFKTHADDESRENAAGEQQQPQVDQHRQQRKGSSRPWRTAPIGARKPSVIGNGNGHGNASARESANATGDVPVSLADQWNVTQRRRAGLKRSLDDARDSTQRMLFAKGVVDFDQVLTLLRGK